MRLRKELPLCVGSGGVGMHVCVSVYIGVCVTPISVPIEVERGGNICIACVSLLSCILVG